MSLLSRQFIGGCYSGNSQQRLQKHRQTIVDCIRHLDVLITPAVETDNTSALYSSAGGGNPARAHSNNNETTTTGQCRAPFARVRICSPPGLSTFDILYKNNWKTRINPLTFHSSLGTKSLAPSSPPEWERQESKNYYYLLFVFRLIQQQRSHCPLIL